MFLLKDVLCSVMITIEELHHMKESENHVEFKEGRGGCISYDGGQKVQPKDRRRCILGYVVALCNEGGGYFVVGMKDRFPHEVIGTAQNEGSIGCLEANIYRDTQIRTSVYELYEEGKRVLVIEIPKRPCGRVYKFEDVPLMRVGEELKPMSDEVHLKILNEQEPDFSAQICDGLKINELNKEAINILKQKYALKQNNPRFLTLSDKQILIDLDLLKNNKLTYAALILLGERNAINKYLPQAIVRVEYRNTENQIHFDNRINFIDPFFILIDKLWETINLRNGSFPVQEDAYIFDIPYFNEEVIREAVNNSIAHRNYRMNSEIVIKQYPMRLDIINPGGFPTGVTPENILTVPSTPRNRLFADVLEKTGVVERSGQGVDKIFYNTLSEGKASPDYSNTDDFSVQLSLSAMIEDKAFALFIESVQSELPDDNKLSVLEIVALNKIREKKSRTDVGFKEIQALLNRGLIEKRGKTRGVYYILSKDYYDFTDQRVEYSKLTDWDEEQSFSIIRAYLEKHKKIKMGEIVALFEGRLTRKQVRNIVVRWEKAETLSRTGKGNGTIYFLSEKYKRKLDLYFKAINLGLKELGKREN